MRAVGVFTHGGPEVLQIVELPEVHAGPGQVRVRVHAATVNPTDMAVRNGARAEQQKADPPPYVPGMEIAGILDEVGAGVPAWLRLGDAVMGIVVPKSSHGAYRAQIVLDADSVVRAPAGRTHVAASTLPMNGLTARQSVDLLKLSPGQVIAVTGAAGAYGGYVIQLAKTEGLTVIADAAEKDEALVRSLGADIVVRRGDDVAARFREHFAQGVDGLADGAVLNERAIPAVRDGMQSASRGGPYVTDPHLHNHVRPALTADAGECAGQDVAPCDQVAVAATLHPRAVGAENKITDCHAQPALSLRGVAASVPHAPKALVVTEGAALRLAMEGPCCLVSRCPRNLIR
jgi:NADPH2:quinone reductase